MTFKAVYNKVTGHVDLSVEEPKDDFYQVIPMGASEQVRYDNWARLYQLCIEFSTGQTTYIPVNCLKKMLVRCDKGVQRLWIDITAGKTVYIPFPTNIEENCILWKQLTHTCWGVISKIGTQQKTQRSHCAA